MEEQNVPIIHVDSVGAVSLSSSVLCSLFEAGEHKHSTIPSSISLIRTKYLLLSNPETLEWSNIPREPATQQKYSGPHGRGLDTLVMAQQAPASEETWPMEQKEAV